MPETRSLSIGGKRGDWLSSCCGAAMTTAGGDGTDGSTCWAECRKCGQPCDPIAPGQEGER